VPVSGTVKEVVGELFARVSVPENVPAVEGAKLTMKVEELPGAIVRGGVSPEEAKPAPDREACVTVRLAVPGLEIVSVCIFVVPVVTLPNPTEDGVTEIWD